MERTDPGAGRADRPGWMAVNSQKDASRHGRRRVAGQAEEGCVPGR